MITYLNMKVISMKCDPSKIALAIFSYNRPQHLNALYQAIEHLKLENQYCFHLFNDGPKASKTRDIALVQDLTDKFSNRVSNCILSRKTENLGLAKSIRSGLDSVFTKHEKAIILEDDIIPTIEFFEAMEFFLTNSIGDRKIGSITGANTTRFPFYVRDDFLARKRHSSWGWATWADRWVSIDWRYVERDFLFDKQLIKKIKRVSPDLVRYAKLQELGEIDSWATAMNIDFIKRDLLCIVPRQNLISNIGFDGSGTHNYQEYKNQNPLELLSQKIKLKNLHPTVEESKVYNLFVRLDNSLLRDFPKGTIMRLALKFRNWTRRSSKNS